MPIPTYKITEKAYGGVSCRIITQDVQSPSVLSAHQDDFYIFGLLTNGECTVSVDFNELQVPPHSIFCVQPGQVHSWIDSQTAEGYNLVMDSSFLSDKCKLILDRSAVDLKPIEIGGEQEKELALLFSILYRKTILSDSGVSSEIIRNLSNVIAGTFAEIIDKRIVSSATSNRYREILSAFKQQLIKEISTDRSPSYYAAKLNISLVYLNEVVKSLTGLSVSKYIQSEVMLQAKRLLAHTSMNIQEIALELGFEDYAYFSRLFAKSTGVTPTQFRKSYLK